MDGNAHLHHKTLTCLATCRHCGHTFPFQGPLRTIQCPACNGDNQRKPKTVALTILAKDDCGPQTCLCGAPVDLSAIPIDLDGEVICPSCAAAIPVFPPPAWLLEFLPALRQIVGGEREGVTNPPTTIKAGPTALSCPRCNASLQLDGDSKRTSICSYCGTTVALPDDIWRALHPVARARPWTIVWQGELDLRDPADKPRPFAFATRPKAPTQPPSFHEATDLSSLPIAHQPRRRLVFILLIAILLGAAVSLLGAYLLVDRPKVGRCPPDCE